MKREPGLQRPSDNNESDAIILESEADVGDHVETNLQEDAYHAPAEDDSMRLDWRQPSTDASPQTAPLPIGQM